MTVVLDGCMMQDRNSAHDHIKTQLDFPDYYGRNLDALYDLLTERGEPLTILVQNHTKIYTGAVLNTLYDASAHNSALNIIVERNL
ncbi:MAG: ribonuclease inhibitor [Ruminococcaceae bacterium]|nr:ribonuclease inhibitor [Oscillospiraceae bacterium]